ncbi:MAG: hypothetical protein QGH83_04415 [Candidatus Pacebacteria bacterium]|jgi:hypothetical protein|nr:hypothetical protein [Candidatus Paceibacterota bacterium]|tara:strand:- start:386 stop:616 length:231 start_codon:yes stop_codon:yes gene_type:complete
MADRADERLWKLVGNDERDPPIISKRNLKSIESELEAYQSKFKGGRPRSVRDRIDRLKESIDILTVEKEEKKKNNA